MFASAGLKALSESYYGEELPGDDGLVLFILNYLVVNHFLPTVNEAEPGIGIKCVSSDDDDEDISVGGFGDAPKLRAQLTDYFTNQFPCLKNTTFDLTLLGKEGNNENVYLVLSLCFQAFRKQATVSLLDTLFNNEHFHFNHLIQLIKSLYEYADQQEEPTRQGEIRRFCAFLLAAIASKTKKAQADGQAITAEQAAISCHVVIQSELATHGFAKMDAAWSHFELDEVLAKVLVKNDLERAILSKLTDFCASDLSYFQFFRMPTLFAELHTRANPEKDFHKNFISFSKNVIKLIKSIYKEADSAAKMQALFNCLSQEYWYYFVMLLPELSQCLHLQASPQGVTIDVASVSAEDCSAIKGMANIDAAYVEQRCAQLDEKNDDYIEEMHRCYLRWLTSDSPEPYPHRFAIVLERCYEYNMLYKLAEATGNRLALKLGAEEQRFLEQHKIVRFQQVILPALWGPWNRNEIQKFYNRIPKKLTDEMLKLLRSANIQLGYYFNPAIKHIVVSFYLDYILTSFHLLDVDYDLFEILNACFAGDDITLIPVHLLRIPEAIKAVIDDYNELVERHRKELTQSQVQQAKQADIALQKALSNIILTSVAENDTRVFRFANPVWLQTVVTAVPDYAKSIGLALQAGELVFMETCAKHSEQQFVRSVIGEINISSNEPLYNALSLVSMSMMSDAQHVWFNNLCRLTPAAVMLKDLSKDINDFCAVLLELLYGKSSEQQTVPSDIKERLKIFVFYTFQQRLKAVEELGYIIISRILVFNEDDRAAIREVLTLLAEKLFTHVQHDALRELYVEFFAKGESIYYELRPGINTNTELFAKYRELRMIRGVSVSRFPVDFYAKLHELFLDGCSELVMAEADSVAPIQERLDGMCRILGRPYADVLSGVYPETTRSVGYSWQAGVAASEQYTSVSLTAKPSHHDFTETRRAEHSRISTDKDGMVNNLKRIITRFIAENTTGLYDSSEGRLKTFFELQMELRESWTPLLESFGLNNDECEAIYKECLEGFVRWNLDRVSHSVLHSLYEGYEKKPKVAVYSKLVAFVASTDLEDLVRQKYQEIDGMLVKAIFAYMFPHVARKLYAEDVGKLREAISIDQLFKASEPLAGYSPHADRMLNVVVIFDMTIEEIVEGVQHDEKIMSMLDEQLKAILDTRFGKDISFELLVKEEQACSLNEFIALLLKIDIESIMRSVESIPNAESSLIKRYVSYFLFRKWEGNVDIKEYAFLLVLFLETRVREKKASKIYKALSEDFLALFSFENIPTELELILSACKNPDRFIAQMLFDPALQEHPCSLFANDYVFNNFYSIRRAFYQYIFSDVNQDVARELCDVLMRSTGLALIPTVILNLSAEKRVLVEQYNAYVLKKRAEQEEKTEYNKLDAGIINLILLDVKLNHSLGSEEEKASVYAGLRTLVSTEFLGVLEALLPEAFYALGLGSSTNREEAFQQAQQAKGYLVEERFRANNTGMDFATIIASYRSFDAKNPETLVSRFCLASLVVARMADNFNDSETSESEPEGIKLVRASMEVLATLLPEYYKIIKAQLTELIEDLNAVIFRMAFTEQDKTKERYGAEFVDRLQVDCYKLIYTNPTFAKQLGLSFSARESAKSAESGGVQTSAEASPSNAEIRAMVRGAASQASVAQVGTTVTSIFAGEAVNFYALTLMTLGRLDPALLSANKERRGIIAMIEVCRYWLLGQVFTIPRDGFLEDLIGAARRETTMFDGCQIQSGDVFPLTLEDINETFVRLTGSEQSAMFRELVQELVVSIVRAYLLKVDVLLLQRNSVPFKAEGVFAGIKRLIDFVGAEYVYTTLFDEIMNADSANKDALRIGFVNHIKENRDAVPVNIANHIECFSRQPLRYCYEVMVAIRNDKQQVRLQKARNTFVDVDLKCIDVHSAVADFFKMFLSGFKPQAFREFLIGFFSDQSKPLSLTTRLFRLPEKHAEIAREYDKNMQIKLSPAEYYNAMYEILIVFVENSGFKHAVISLPNVTEDEVFYASLEEQGIKLVRYRNGKVAFADDNVTTEVVSKYLCFYYLLQMFVDLELEDAAKPMGAVAFSWMAGDSSVADVHQKLYDIKRKLTLLRDYLLFKEFNPNEIGGNPLLVDVAELDEVLREQNAAHPYSRKNVIACLSMCDYMPERFAEYIYDSIITEYIKEQYLDYVLPDNPEDETQLQLPVIVDTMNLLDLQADQILSFDEIQEKAATKLLNALLGVLPDKIRAGSDSRHVSSQQWLKLVITQIKEMRSRWRLETEIKKQPNIFEVFILVVEKLQAFILTTTSLQSRLNILYAINTLGGKRVISNFDHNFNLVLNGFDQAGLYYAPFLYHACALYNFELNSSLTPGVAHFHRNRSVVKPSPDESFIKLKTFFSAVFMDRDSSPEHLQLKNILLLVFVTSQRPVAQDEFWLQLFQYLPSHKQDFVEKNYADNVEAARIKLIKEIYGDAVDVASVERAIPVILRRVQRAASVDLKDSADNLAKISAALIEEVEQVKTRYIKAQPIQAAKKKAGKKKAGK